MFTIWFTLHGETLHVDCPTIYIARMLWDDLKRSQDCKPINERP